MLEFGDEQGGDLAPLAGDQLLVTGDLGSAVNYADCLWWIGGPVDGPSDTDADFTRTYSAPGFTGKTLVTWNLTLRRVGR